MATGAFRGPQSSGAARKLLRVKGAWCFVSVSIGVVGGDGSRRRSRGICIEVFKELRVFYVFWRSLVQNVVPAVVLVCSSCIRVL
jgi:hypothetical protein